MQIMAQAGMYVYIYTYITHIKHYIQESWEMMIFLGLNGFAVKGELKIF